MRVIGQQTVYSAQWGKDTAMSEKGLTKQTLSLHREEREQNEDQSGIDPQVPLSQSREHARTLQTPAYYKNAVPKPTRATCTDHSERKGDPSPRLWSDADSEGSSDDERCPSRGRQRLKTSRRHKTFSRETSSPSPAAHGVSAVQSSRREKRRRSPPHGVVKQRRLASAVHPAGTSMDKPTVDVKPSTAAAAEKGSVIVAGSAKKTSDPTGGLVSYRPEPTESAAARHMLKAHRTIQASCLNSEQATGSQQEHRSVPPSVPSAGQPKHHAARARPCHDGGSVRPGYSETCSARVRPGYGARPGMVRPGHNDTTVRVRPGYDTGPVRVHPGHGTGPVRVRSGYDSCPVRVRPGYGSGSVRVRPGHDGIWSGHDEGFWHQPAYRINAALFPGSQQAQTVQSRPPAVKTGAAASHNAPKGVQTDSQGDSRRHGDGYKHPSTSRPNQLLSSDVKQTIPSCDPRTEKSGQPIRTAQSSTRPDGKHSNTYMGGHADKRMTSQRPTLTSRPTPLEVLQKVRASKMTAPNSSNITNTSTQRPAPTSRPTPLEALQKVRASQMAGPKASNVTNTETSTRQHSWWSSDSESESDDESCWCLECFKCRIMGTDVPHEDKFAVTQQGGDKTSFEQARDSVGSSPSLQSVSANDSSRHGDKRTESSKRVCCSLESTSDGCKRIKLSGQSSEMTSRTSCSSNNKEMTSHARCPSNIHDVTHNLGHGG
ncbi:uncharacterized protein LOC144878031 [Branchiostoma floridae x Branchiostoma japonicum]